MDGARAKETKTLLVLDYSVMAIVEKVWKWIWIDNGLFRMNFWGKNGILYIVFR